jgi:hypothetical protein
LQKNHKYGLIQAYNIMVERRTSSGRHSGIQLSRVRNNTFGFPARADTFARPLTFADKSTINSRKAFGDEQVKVSNEALAGLNELTTNKPQITEQDWREVYEWFIDWRYDFAVKLSGHQFGGNIPLNLDLIRRKVSDDAPNNEIIGNVGWLRVGATWVEETNTWEGGLETPSSEITRDFGQLALQRFTNAEKKPGDDVLQNVVTLPDGTSVNGNKLLRGNAIKDMREERIAMRGPDAKRFYPEDDICIAVSGEPEDREKIFNSVMMTLAEQKPGEGTFDTWANCSYLLYQAPITKRGWDAVIRNFIVVSGIYMLGSSPKIPQDIDFSAFVVGQQEFVEYLREYNCR